MLWFQGLEHTGGEKDCSPKFPRGPTGSSGFPFGRPLDPKAGINFPARNWPLGLLTPLSTLAWARFQGDAGDYFQTSQGGLEGKGFNQGQGSGGQNFFASPRGKKFLTKTGPGFETLILWFKLGKPGLRKSFREREFLSGTAPGRGKGISHRETGPPFLGGGRPFNLIWAFPRARGFFFYPLGAELERGRTPPGRQPNSGFQRLTRVFPNLETRPGGNETGPF